MPSPGSKSLYRGRETRRIAARRSICRSDESGRRGHRAAQREMEENQPDARNAGASGARSVTSVTRPQLVGWQSSVSQHRRGIARPVVRHGIPRWVHLLASACVAALMIGTALGAPLSADADTYPSWDDVKAAKANTANTAESITKLSGIITKLKNQVDATLAVAQKKTDELMAAKRRADGAEANADAHTVPAQTAGRLAAQLYRSGGTDSVLSLFLSGGNAAQTDQLLQNLADMQKLAGRASDIYQTAQQKQNTATALGAQANIAVDARAKLQAVAQTALEAAQAAQVAAQTALAAQQENQVKLEAQLAFLKDTETKTAAAYQQGEQIRQAEEARRKAAEAAARAPGVPVSSRWALPARGRITDVYGPRARICEGGLCSGTFHYGIDIGTGCNASIYAANSGAVVFSGWAGTYGNFIKIDHGGGVYTGYAHIRDGGRFVGVGDRVTSGQNIASAGKTGASNGCHLHFEVYNGARRIDPIPFMADRGVRIG